jgi:hypothetical protein
VICFRFTFSSPAGVHDVHDEAAGAGDHVVDAVTLRCPLRETGGAMRVQRVLMPGSEAESWTLLGDDQVPVEPAEQFLGYLSAVERSPNTVKAYAHDLKETPTAASPPATCSTSFKQSRHAATAQGPTRPPRQAEHGRRSRPAQATGSPAGRHLAAGTRPALYQLV